jgi:CMP-N-acetylneuraminic acid synthetase
MAKEGSIGLPGKNIWNIKGMTLLEWAIADARNSKAIDKIFVSTNGQETAKISAKAGAEVITRDNELAKNEKFMESVDQAVKYIKSRYPALEIIAMPQCVVPFRDPDIFNKCISFLLDNPEYDSVVTVRRVGYIPEALMRREGDMLIP